MYMNKFLKVLNVCRWIIVICCPIAFFVVAIVCRYQQIHYNAQTGELFVTGFAIIVISFGCGMCLGFPKDYVEISEKIKASDDKYELNRWHRKFTNVVMSNVGSIVLIFGGIMMLLR